MQSGTAVDRVELVSRGRTGQSRWVTGPAVEVALDAVMLAAAMIVAALTAPIVDLRAPVASWLIGFPVITLVVLGVAGAYRVRFAPDLLRDLRAIVFCTALAAMSLTLADAITGDGSDAGLQASRQWVLAVTYMSAGRIGYQLALRWQWRRGRLAEPALIVGAGTIGHQVARHLQNRVLGVEPVAFFDDDPLERSGGPSLPVIGPSATAPETAAKGVADRLEDAIRRRGIEHVIVTFSRYGHAEQLDIVRRCQLIGVSVSLVPRLFETVPDRTELERLGGLPLLTVHPTNPRSWRFTAKYLLGRVLAAGLIVAAAPLLIAIALAVRVTGGTPVLFRQKRVGLDGEPFEMLKFRTMRSTSEEARSEHAIAEAMVRGAAVGPGGVDDPNRLTRIGAFLRQTSLDELPQLFNVLRGDMTLVGPRPERPEFVSEFDQTVHRYAERHRVKAGMTGWAQVHGLRGKTSLEDRIEWDNYYIENWSLWLDVKILAMTVIAMFTFREP